MTELTKHTVIVVARFDEDISWLHPIAKNCIIYNKGGAVPDPELFKRVIQLDNVGRESHTYLTHILNDTVNDTVNDTHQNEGRRRKETRLGVTVFIQGKISDHIREDISPLDFILKMVTESIETGQSKNADLYSHLNMKPSETFKVAGRYNVRDSNLCFGPWFRKYVCVNNEKRDIDDKYSYPHLSHLASLSPVATYHLTEYAPDLSYAPLNAKMLPWYIGAIFGVRNDRIRQHPREYYERILNTVNDGNNIEEGHFLERSWFYIFNNHSKTRDKEKNKKNKNVFIL